MGVLDKGSVGVPLDRAPEQNPGSPVVPLCIFFLMGFPD